MLSARARAAVDERALQVKRSHLVYAQVILRPTVLVMSSPSGSRRIDARRVGRVGWRTDT